MSFLSDVLFQIISVLHFYLQVYRLLKVFYNGIFPGLNFLPWKLCITIMRLVILDNYDLASEWAAKYICNRIIQFKPGQDRYFTLGLPTGNNIPFLSHFSH